MQKASFRRNVFLLILLAVLIPVVEAAASPLDFFDRFWAFVESVWSESGASFDPNGAPAPQGDEGSSLNPDGPASPQTDTGSHIDPNG